MKADVESTNFLNESKSAVPAAIRQARRVARPSVARVIPLGSGATIKRQKVPRLAVGRSFRSPPLSSTLLQQSARVSLNRRKGPRKRALAYRRASVLCRANNGARCSAAARCFNSVSKHTPTLLRGGRERPRGLSHGIRLTCGICSASETSRRERRDCAFLPDARRVEDIGPYSRRTLDAEHVCPNPYLTVAVQAKFSC